MMDIKQQLLSESKRSSKRNHWTISYSYGSMKSKHLHGYKLLVNGFNFTPDDSEGLKPAEMERIVGSRSNISLKSQIMDGAIYHCYVSLKLRGFVLIQHYS